MFSTSDRSVKSFSISCAARSVVLVGLILLSACAESGIRRNDPATLTNPALSPGLSQWLVGAIAHLANDQEIRQYLALSTDSEAKRFIDHFWAVRNPYPKNPGNALRQLYERRARAADRLYSEGGVVGRHTDRGAIFILYGPPARTTFEVGPQRKGGPALVVWKYPPDAKPGLDGRKPDPVYRFWKPADLTVLYRGRVQRPLTPNLGGPPSPELALPSQGGER